jgi:hypothetical protein
MDSTNLSPSSHETINNPPISISKKFSPRLLRCSSPSSPIKPNSPVRFNNMDLYEKKLKTLGELFIITKKELIDNFNTGYFTMGFWTSVQTKTLGTFLVVTSPGSKMHFISMRRKFPGCNFQYDSIKNNIRTKNCSCCELNFNCELQESIYYEFPEEVIILTPIDPYLLPTILSKM